MTTHAPEPTSHQSAPTRFVASGASLVVVAGAFAASLAIVMRVAVGG